MSKKSRFSNGDYIYYLNPNGGHDPHKVLDTRHRGYVSGWWVLLDDGRWVKSANCQLQSEWAKENAQ